MRIDGWSDLYPRQWLRTLETCGRVAEIISAATDGGEGRGLNLPCFLEGPSFHEQTENGGR